MSSIKVLIVEDELLIAKDINGHLDDQGYTVTGLAYNYEDAIESLSTDTPDLVLLDINLNGELDGFKVAELINKEYNIPFIFITSYATESILERAKHTRPAGYIVKPFRADNIFSAIEIGLYNHANLNKPKNFSLKFLNNKILGEISAAEFKVLNDIYDGKTNKQVSQELGISVNTIKTHLTKVYSKLDVQSRTEAIAKIRELL